MRHTLAILVLAVIGFAAAAGAQQTPEVAFGAGLFDTAAWFDDRGDFDTWEAGVEWRGASRWPLGIGPILGASVNGDSGFWAYGGGRRPFAVTDRWSVALSFAAVYYDRGDGKDLGQELEFRSGIDVGRRNARGRLLAVEFYHLSNSSLSDVNPGVNSLRVVYSIPLG